MKLAIKTKRLLTPLSEIRDAILLIDGENIETVGLQSHIPVPAEYEVWDVGEHIVAQGGRLREGRLLCPQGGAGGKGGNRRSQEVGADELPAPGVDGIEEGAGDGG